MIKNTNINTKKSNKETLMTKKLRKNFNERNPKNKTSKPSLRLLLVMKPKLIIKIFKRMSSKRSLITNKKFKLKIVMFKRSSLITKLNRSKVTLLNHHSQTITYNRIHKEYCLRKFCRSNRKFKNNK